MRKLAAFLIILLIILTSAVSSYGEGIYVSSDNDDIIRIFEDATVSEPVRGNIITVLGNITVNERVNGHVVTVFGDSEVNAEVTGQVVSIFGSVFLKENAVVISDVITIGPLHKSEGAVIHGQEVRIFGESMNLDLGALSYLRLLILILFTLAVLIIGFLMLLISRTRYKSISRSIDKNIGRKFILGILSFIGASSLLVILLMTLIAPLFYIVLLIISTVPACMFIGRFILRTFSQNNSIYAEFITGLVSVTLVKLLIFFMTPQQNMFIGLIAVGLLNIAIYSLGMGIFMEQYYLKNDSAEHKKGKPDSKSETQVGEDAKPEPQ
jgi:hypothetical protein